MHINSRFIQSCNNQLKQYTPFWYVFHSRISTSWFFAQILPFIWFEFLWRVTPSHTSRNGEMFPEKRPRCIVESEIVRWYLCFELSALKPFASALLERKRNEADEQVDAHIEQGTREWRLNVLNCNVCGCVCLLGSNIRGRNIVQYLLFL